MSQPPTDKNGLGLLEQRSRWLDEYRLQTRFTEYGRVVSVGDGIAWVGGLPSAGLEDMLLFDDGSQAMVFDLTEDLLGAVLLQQTPGLTAGTPVRLAGHRPRIVVGQPLLGRVVDPLGQPLDGGLAPDTPHLRPLFAPSPPIIARERVTRPLYTGSKVLDTLLPVGKGQRQLLVGDEGLGRSALAIDAVINQRGSDVLCVYVLSGQKRSTVVNTISTLKTAGAMDYTVVVVAEASALPGLQHLAPYAGCALAEYWMQQGRDTLVIYDDLSAHARIYRELSLLLRRPPGREAYPGDIFSIHAQLLERTTSLNAGHGGGSMTALPIVETQQGEIAAYIPTNLISITDGQAYLDAQLFAGGFRPAIDIPRSVSRIGGQAQHPVIKKEAGRMKLDYLQFLELEVFTRFGTKLEASMEKAINRGRTLRELLKQERLAPHSPVFQVAWLKAFNQGFFEPVPLSRISVALGSLAAKVAATAIALDSEPEAWQALLADWRANLPPANGVAVPQAGENPP